LAKFSKQPNTFTRKSQILSGGKGILKTDGKAIIISFLAAIIAVVIIGAIANTETFASTKLNVDNQSQITGTGVTDLEGKVATGFSAFNATNNITVPTTNYSIGTGVTDGLPTAQIDTANAGVNFSGYLWNVTYDYEPLGYVSDGASRTILALVVLFGALAILVTVVVILIKNGTLGNLMGRG